MQEIKCIVVVRKRNGSFDNEITDYLICSGSNIGRWSQTLYSLCLADNLDAKQYALKVANDTPNTKVINYIIKPE